MPATLRIHLTPEEDARLRELETNPVVPFKVRRRAQAVRLAAQGWTAPRIARHLGLDRTTLHRDLRRWPERGIEGLGQRSYLANDKKSFRSLPSSKSTRLAKRLSERPRLCLPLLRGRRREDFI